MDTTIYNILVFILIVGVIGGIKLMNSPKTAVKGNLLGSLSMLGAIIVTLIRYNIVSALVLYLALAIGAVIGAYFAIKISMIKIPQLVALLNGFGGGASALVALAAFINLTNQTGGDVFSRVTGSLALIVGGLTLSGSLIAAGKLARILSQKVVVLKGHGAIQGILIAAMLVLTVLTATAASAQTAIYLFILTLLLAFIFGVIFTIRVGGADMPVTISLLNSFSGVASSLAGFVVKDPLLVAVGGVVGAAGLILTQNMCQAMNRSLMQILTGKTSQQAKPEEGAAASDQAASDKAPEAKKEAKAAVEKKSPKEILKDAKRVIIVPGYGMALARAQMKVKVLADKLEKQGKEVVFAIHPIAGRMPGHMNVLLAEADVDYEALCELETANPMFKETDAVIVVGANDVINPAAIHAEGTPIYGMPILRVDEAKHTIICNFDTKPGYAGVDNALYEADNVIMLLGDANDTVDTLISDCE